MKLSPAEAQTIKDAVESALVEVEGCEDISQGVEDGLREAKEIMNERHQDAID